MNFQVAWLEQATESLARAYLTAKLRGQADAVTAAMAEVDRLLEITPSSVGESRSGNTRIVIVPPIVVDYEVFVETQFVVVTEARYRGG